MNTPLVESFLSRCAEQDLTADQTQAAITTACFHCPDVADEFEKASFDWKSFGRGALRTGGGIAGGALGFTTSAIPGVAASIASGGLASIPAVAGVGAATAAGGYGGEEAGRILGDTIFGKEEDDVKPAPLGKTPDAQSPQSGSVKTSFDQLMQKMAASPWEVLGIPWDAPPEVWKKALRDLMAKYHPDRHIGNESA